MSELNSIHQFFTEIGCHFQCYDMGRLIKPVEQQTFIDFEQTSIPWNSPFMQHAWLALVFRETGGNKNHTVWFLKLPLDEQAKLNLAARDDFLHRLFETLANYLDSSLNRSLNNVQNGSLENAMKDSPYGFQPKQEQMANFHAMVHKDQALAASQYYPSTQKYFSSIKRSDIDEYEQWSQLGLQGIADLAARLDEEYQGNSNQLLITQAVPYLPIPVFQVLSHCLENHITSELLVQAIFDRLSLEQEQEENKVRQEFLSLCTGSIRASAQSSNPELQSQLLSLILKSTASTNIEVLAAISGRCWQQLFKPQILSLFLEALSRTGLDNSPYQSAFNAIMSDLLFIPGMRDTIIQAFRSPERSEQLTQAIGDFFSSKKLPHKISKTG